MAVPMGRVRRWLVRRRWLPLAARMALLPPIAGGNLGGQGLILKSIQYGTIAYAVGSNSPVNGATATATITAVNTAKAVLIPLGVSSVGSDDPVVLLTARLALTNSTTVTGAFNGKLAAGGTFTAGFVVVEFA